MKTVDANTSSTLSEQTAEGVSQHEDDEDADAEGEGEVYHQILRIHN
jgi:hypothetical protein